MSLLRRIFGGRTFEEDRSQADRLFDEGRFGEAKLAYERVLDRAGDRPEDTRDALSAKINECRDNIALGRIESGRRHLDGGEIDLAVADLEGALEVAASEAVASSARELLDGLEREDAREQATEVEVSDEDTLAAIAGSWEEEQEEEYEDYGEDFTSALVAMHSGRPEEAREKLEGILAQALEEHADEDDDDVEGPCYLWLEVGRARLLTSDLEGGAAALRSFLDSVHPSEGGEARLVAHMELARLADERDDFDGAVAELTAAVDELEEDPRPFLALGQYLRVKNHAKEAVDVLEAATAVMGDSRPEWRILEELGLAYRDAGQAVEARETLEGVVALLSARGHTDLPPQTAVALAALFEAEERPERAADMYRSLTAGSDRTNHLLYHREAARLLALAGLNGEARRMLQRAVALAPNDSEEAKAVADQLEALGDGT